MVAMEQLAELVVMVVEEVVVDLDTLMDPLPSYPQDWVDTLEHLELLLEAPSNINTSN